jgi:hypothetical protein
MEMKGNVSNENTKGAGSVGNRGKSPTQGILAACRGRGWEGRGIEGYSVLEESGPDMMKKIPLLRGNVS